MEFINSNNQDDMIFSSAGFPQNSQMPALTAASSIGFDSEDLPLPTGGRELERKDNDEDTDISSASAASRGGKKQRSESQKTPSSDDDSSPLPSVPLSQTGTSSFGEMDVLSGRGGGTNVHSGNRQFRDLINLHRRAYLKARKNDKPAISRKIVQAIRKNRGRFLKKDEASGLWFEIGDAAAREKVAQALRQRAPEMRRILFDSEREDDDLPDESNVGALSEDQMLQQQISPVRTQEHNMGLPFQQQQLQQQQQQQYGGCDIPQTSLNGASSSAFNPTFFAMVSGKNAVGIPSLPSDPYSQMFSAAFLDNGMNCFTTNGA